MLSEPKVQSSPPPLDTGLICLVMMARFHNLAADPDHLAHQHRAGEQLTTPELLLAAKQLGLQIKSCQIELTRLTKTPLPAIAVDRDGGFFVIAKVEGDQVLIQCPRVGRPQNISLQELQA